MKIIPAQPSWGETLAPGYCGFITRERDIVGDGIAWFERFELGLPFVHTFVVESLAGSLNAPLSAINIIEAHATTGVARARLDQYLGQKEVQCFIRIPKGWTPDIGAKIAASAAMHLGEKYAFSLIVADALANTWLGHGINWVTQNQWDQFICWAFSNTHKKICSQLVALALQSQFHLRLRGCLRRPADTIMPRELGNDHSLWDPCMYKLEPALILPGINVAHSQSI
jgi:hypothetical protein